MQELGRMTRRDLLSAAGAATLLMLLRSSAPRTAAAADFDVTGRSIRELQAAMTAGQITSVDLVHAYLERIAAFDQQGPALNAVLYLNPNAVQMAADLDAERATGRLRGPLQGIPVLLKDNYETYDMPTTGAYRWPSAGRNPSTTRFRSANYAMLVRYCSARSICTSLHLG